MKIGIIGAMEKEITKLFSLFNLEKIDNKFFIYKATIDNKELYVMKCGVGKVNSALMTQYLIDTYKVDVIINTGCAGSLTDKVKVLDTIIGEYVTYHDFSPIRVMEDYVPEKGKIKIDTKLLDLTRNFFDEKAISYHIGAIASGDCFVTSSKMRDDIYNRTNCLAVDMESMSIGQVAKLNNVPFLIIRTISDFSDGEVELEEKASDISASLITEIINQL